MPYGSILCILATIRIIFLKILTCKSFIAILNSILAILKVLNKQKNNFIAWPLRDMYEDVTSGFLHFPRTLGKLNSWLVFFINIIT